MVNTVLSSMIVSIASGDEATSLLQTFAGVRRHSLGQRIAAAVAKEGSTICLDAAVGDVAPVAGSFIAQMSQQAVEVAAGSVAEQAGSFCVPKQDVLLMQRTFGLNSARDFENALGAKKKKATTATTTTMDFEDHDFAGASGYKVMVSQCPGENLLQTMDATVAHKGGDDGAKARAKAKAMREADEMRVCECRSFLKNSVGKVWQEQSGKLQEILASKQVGDAIENVVQQTSFVLPTPKNRVGENGGGIFNPSTLLLQRNLDAALATKKSRAKTTTTSTTTTTIDQQSQEKLIAGMQTACTTASELSVELFGNYGMANKMQLPSWAIVAKLLNDPAMAVLYEAANITQGWRHCDQSWVVHGACHKFLPVPTPMPTAPTRTTLPDCPLNEVQYWPSKDYTCSHTVDDECIRCTKKPVIISPQWRGVDVTPPVHNGPVVTHINGKPVERGSNNGFDDRNFNNAFGNGNFNNAFGR